MTDTRLLHPEVTERCSSLNSAEQAGGIGLLATPGTGAESNRKQDEAAISASPNPRSRSPSPPRRRQFSRSPRPYCRSRVNPSLGEKYAAGTELINSDGPTQALWNVESPNKYDGKSNLSREIPSVEDQQQTSIALASSSSHERFTPLAQFYKHYGNRSGTGTAGSESGTEADDELPRKLPAPPTRRRRRWDAESHEEEEEGEDGMSSRNSGGYFDGIDTEAVGKWGKWKRKSVSIGGRKAQEEVLLVVNGLGLKGRRILFVQRGIEAGLMMILAAIVVAAKKTDGDMRILDVIVDNWAVETVTWLLTASVLVGRYILHVRSQSRMVRPTTLPSPHKPPIPGVIQLPRSLDPSPLLYPVILPPIVGVAISSTLFLQNLILSLASLPISFFPDFSIYWALSLSPLFASRVSNGAPDILSAPSPICSSFSELLACLPFLQHSLTLVLAHILEPSLTITEIRLLSACLINLLINTTSPQAVVLKALLWYGGLGVILLCSELVVWNIQLARIPRHRFRRVANVVKGMNRFQNTIFNHRARDENESSSTEELKGKSSMVRTERIRARSQKVELMIKDGGEGNKFSISIELNPSAGNNSTKIDKDFGPPTYSRISPMPTLKKRRTSSSIASYYTHLTYAQALRRKYAYAGAVYLIVLGLVLFLLRPYIAHHAFHDVDPFLWAASYLFCGIGGYSTFTAYTTRLLGFGLDKEGDGWTGCGVWADSKEWTIARGGIFPEEEANRRLLMCSYFAIILTLGICAVMVVRKMAEVDTRRKVFHGMVVAMFLLVSVLDPQFIHLALSLVLAIFLLLDLFRAAQIPPISRPLSQFLTPFVDGRDLKGPVVVSHIFLLVGCALPIWLTHASIFPIPRSAPWKAQLSSLTGVISVGLGDSAASLIGRRFGKHKWGWPGGKSLEGSFAFMMVVFLGLIIGRAWVLHLNMTYGNDMYEAIAANNGNNSIVNVWPLPWGDSWGGKDVWLKLIAISAGASMMEAVVTGVNDNVAVPVALWLIIRSFGL